MTHKFRYLLLILLILNGFFGHTLLAQDFDSEYWMSWYKDPIDVIGVGDWEQKEWIAASAIVTTGVILYTQDEAIREQFQSFRTPSTDNFSKYVAEPIGSGYYSIGISAAAYGVGWIIEDPKLRRTSIQAVKAYVLTGGATQILKQLTHRTRPYEMDRSDLWYGPTGISGDFDAFPSGHTSTAFAVASVYAHSYRDRPWVGVVSYSLATLTGLSRIHDDVHWASDVFFGAAFGWYVGKVIVENDSKLMVLPTGNGVSLTWQIDG